MFTFANEECNIYSSNIRTLNTIPLCHGLLGKSFAVNFNEFTLFQK